MSRLPSLGPPERILFQWEASPSSLASLAFCAVAIVAAQGWARLLRLARAAEPVAVVVVLLLLLALARMLSSMMMMTLTMVMMMMMVRV